MYIGIGPTKFDELVTAGRMPAPRTIGGVRVWDIRDFEYGWSPSQERPISFRKGVYIAGFGPYVKIGWSSKVEARIKELQTGAPEPIRVYAVIACIRDREIDLHRRFAELRLSGEWFRNEGELATWITNGCPPLWIGR